MARVAAPAEASSAPAFRSPAKVWVSSWSNEAKTRPVTSTSFDLRVRDFACLRHAVDLVIGDEANSAESIECLTRHIRGIVGNQESENSCGKRATPLP